MRYKDRVDGRYARRVSLTGKVICVCGGGGQVDLSAAVQVQVSGAKLGRTQGTGMKGMMFARL